MTTAELLAREFPDFDLATLPAIPDGFLCCAWHNDSCPVWYDADPDALKAGTRMLTIDFADPDMREWPECPRFTLHRVAVDDTSPEPVFSTDVWDDMLKALANDG